MRQLDRGFRRVGVDIEHLLARAADPGRVLEELIRDLDESVVDLRQRAVLAVDRQKTLERRLSALEESGGEERQARGILFAGLGTLAARDSVCGELADARRACSLLLVDLVRAEDRARLAHRRQDELRRQIPGPPASSRSPAVTQASARGRSEAGAGPEDRVPADR